MAVGPSIPIYEISNDYGVVVMVYASACPECLNGKHGSCESTSWDFDHDDAPCVCYCWHENGGREGGPCFGPPK